MKIRIQIKFFFFSILKGRLSVESKEHDQNRNVPISTYDLIAIICTLDPGSQTDERRKETVSKESRTHTGRYSDSLSAVKPPLQKLGESVSHNRARYDKIVSASLPSSFIERCQ